VRATRLIVLAVAVLSGAALPGVAEAAQTVTLGPALSTSSSSINCPLGATQSPDCAYVDSTEPSGVIATAPADGTITTWRVAGFLGTAQLVVFANDGNGSYTIVQRSAPQTESCTSVLFCGPNNKTPYTFSTSLPITAGQLIGLELTQPSGCTATGLQPTCTFIGTGPTGAASSSFNATPATGAQAQPDGTAAGLLVNADETLNATTTKSVSLSLAPPTITAGGVDTTTATATVTDQSGAPVSGDTVAIKSSDPAEKVGPVTDAGGGHYTGTITASKTVGTATITATDLSDAAQPSASATLTQSAPAITVSLSPGSLFTSVSGLVTVKLTGVQGEKLPGQAVSIATSGDATSGRVRDNGDGTYTTGITAGLAVGTATIKATDSSVSPAVSGSAKLSIRAARGKPKQCVVPKLAGKTVAAARRVLRRAGCTLGRTTRRTSTRVRSGRVISSKPKAGTHRRHGTRVAVIVSRGRH
jgi:Invasin, domain 3/PASTA domain